MLTEASDLTYRESCISFGAEGVGGV